MNDRLDKIRAIVGQVNKKFGTNTASIGPDRPHDIHRIPSGSLLLDRALGGGWPAGRVIMPWGEESSGKTTLTTKALANVQQMCTSCYTWLRGDIDPVTREVTREGCVCGKNRKGIGGVCDVEGTFDFEWAKYLGVNTDELVYVKPESGEESVDIVEALIRSGEIDFLLYDSVAAACPIEELGSSAEDKNVGLHARIMNRAWRVWNAAQNDIENKTGHRPTLMCTNQIRFKIGIMFGNPETRPGGNGQHFATSVEVRMKRAKDAKDQKDKDGNVKQAMPLATLSGRVNKNKTARAGLEYEFQIATESFESKGLAFEKGEIIEIKPIMKLAEHYDLIGKCIDGKGYYYIDKVFDKQKDMHDAMFYDPIGLEVVKDDLRKIFRGDQVRPAKQETVKRRTETTSEESGEELAAT